MTQKNRKPIINIWPYSEVNARLAIILKKRGIIDGYRIDKRKKYEVKLYIRREKTIIIFQDFADAFNEALGAIIDPDVIYEIWKDTFKKLVNGERIEINNTIYEIRALANNK